MLSGFYARLAVRQCLRITRDAAIRRDDESKGVYEEGTTTLATIFLDIFSTKKKEELGTPHRVAITVIITIIQAYGNVPTTNRERKPFTLLLKQNFNCHQEK